MIAVRPRVSGIDEANLQSSMALLREMLS
jgi:hypothetical protein